MKAHHKSIIFAAATLLFTINACIFYEGTPEVAAPPAQIAEATQELPVIEQPTATPVGECFNEFQPVREGATWNYNLTGTATDTFSRRIVIVNERNFTEQDAFTSGVVRDMRWRCREGNLIALNPPSGNFSSINEEGVWIEFEASEVEGVTIPNSMPTGAVWKQTMTIEGKQKIYNVEYKAKNKIENNCTAVGNEAITVPAGTFEATRIDCNVVVDVSLSIEDKPNQTVLTFTNISWYVRGVGLVKSATAGEGINATVELTSYAIP
jgi:hypothetical protein